MDKLKFKSEEEILKMSQNELCSYILNIQDKLSNVKCNSCKKIDFKAENICVQCNKKCCNDCLQNCFFCDSQICMTCKNNMCAIDMYESFCAFCI